MKYRLATVGMIVALIAALAEIGLLIYGFIRIENHEQLSRFAIGMLVLTLLTALYFWWIRRRITMPESAADLSDNF